MWMSQTQLRTQLHNPDSVLDLDLASVVLLLCLPELFHSHLPKLATLGWAMLATLGWAMRPEPAREQALAQAQSPELVLALA